MTSGVYVPKKSRPRPKSHKQLDKKRFQDCLAQLFLSLPPSPRRTLELPALLLASGDHSHLQQMLCEPSVFSAMFYDVSRRRELISTWRTVQEALGCDVISNYADMLCLLEHENEVPRLEVSKQTNTTSPLTLHINTRNSNPSIMNRRALNVWPIIFL